jgi:IclR family pca regulon transcriptional regulator
MSAASDDSSELERWRHPYLADDLRYSQSLERGLAILTCFTPKTPVLGNADVADELGTSRATAHRYIITLVALGYLEQTTKRKYRLGLRVIDLGMSALNSTGLREHSHSYLDELRKRTSYTISLTVLSGPEIVYVDRARSFRRDQGKIDLNIRAGSRHPAYATAMGKVLIAYLPDAEQDQLVSGLTLTKRGPHTIGSKSALRNELAQVRQDGMAVNDEEFTAGLIEIAVPVRDLDRDVVASVGMSAHTSMISLEDMVGQLLPHLRATADQISARLGYRRNDEVRP